MAISLETASSKPSSSSSSSAKAEGAIAVAAFWSTSSSSMAKTSEPLSLSSRSKSLAASSWTVLSSESSSESGTSTSKSVSSKMSFSPFLTAGGGVAASDGLALPGWPCRPAWAAWASDLSVLISSSDRGASSIESWCPRSKAPAPWRLIPESLGRDRLIPERFGIGGRHVRVAGPKRGRLELVAGVQGAELEVAARFGLEDVDQVARGIELEVAVRLGRRDLRRRAGPIGLGRTAVSPEPDGASGSRDRRCRP